jgi:hypothetical protein
MASRIKVAVVSLADGPEATSGASILACLDPMRYERFAVLTHPNESGAMREGVCERVLRVPPLDDEGFVTALVDLVSTEAIDQVLPGSAAAAICLAGCADILLQADAALRLGNYNPADIGKLKQVALASRQALPSEPELHAFEGPWPLLLQKADGSRRRAGDAWEAFRAHQGLMRSNPAGSRAVFVEAVGWSSHGAFEVALISNDRGQALAAAAVRVLADDDHLRPWMAVTVDNEPLVHAAARAALELQLAGPSQYLFRRDERGFALVDGRPGLPLWIEVTQAGGPPLVEILVGLGGDEDAPTLESLPCTPSGVLFSQTAEDVVLA